MNLTFVRDHLVAKPGKYFASQLMVLPRFVVEAWERSVVGEGWGVIRAVYSA